MNKTISLTLNQELPLLINGSKQESNVQSSNQSSGSPVASLEKTELVSIFSTSHINSPERLFDVELNKVSTHPIVMNAYIEKNLYGLKLTMKLVGQLEPIKVVQRQDQYRIFDGVSRYLVAVELGWETIRVEVFDFTDDEIQDQYVLRNFRTKRSLIEMCNQAELILGVLGSSQGKKRDKIGDLSIGDEDFCLAGKDRFELACTILDLSMSASSLRRLIAVKDFQENGTEEVLGLGLMDKLEKGEMKINQAYALMELYTNDKSEQGKNVLTETLDFISGDHYQLYNKTCEDLSDVPEESIDLCIQSNPYYQQRKYPDGTKPVGVIPHGQEGTVDEYVKKQVEVFRGVFNKLKETGNLVIVMADSYNGKHLRVTHKFINAMEEDGWSFIDEWIWKKTNQKPTSLTKRLLPTYEKILHFAKDPEKYYFREFKNWLPDQKFKAVRGRATEVQGKKKEYGWSLKRPLERFRNFLDEQNVAKIIETNVFNWSEFNDIDSKFRHLAPYPSVIPLLPILMLSEPGSAILDVYNGTSTSTAVALQLGRSAIGFDTDTKSHEFATKRLRLVERNLPAENEIQDFENDYLEPAA